MEPHLIFCYFADVCNFACLKDMYCAVYIIHVYLDHFCVLLLTSKGMVCLLIVKAYAFDISYFVYFY